MVLIILVPFVICPPVKTVQISIMNSAVSKILMQILCSIMFTCTSHDSWTSQAWKSQHMGMQTQRLGQCITIMLTEDSINHNRLTEISYYITLETTNDGQTVGVHPSDDSTNTENLFFFLILNSPLMRCFKSNPVWEPLLAKAWGCMTHMSRHKQFCMESVHANALIKKKFSLTLTVEFTATELSITRGSYLIYTEQKYKCNSFVIATIFHELTTKIKDIL